MHNTVKNLIYIEDLIKSKVNDLNYNKIPKIIAVSKTFPKEKILPLIEHGQIDYGENKVKEAIDKWTDIKAKNTKIKLHLIGKLQTNKVKFAVRLFDYIHSVDSEKLAKKISDEQSKQNKKLKMFIQINIGDEEQKIGINKKDVSNFYKYCKYLNLNVIGIMCLPPMLDNSENYFIEMNKINNSLGLTDLSMGMSNDYLKAVKNGATFLRIGSKIFGLRN